MKCPNCGLETMGTGGVCHVCGAPLSPPSGQNDFPRVEYTPKTGKAGDVPAQGGRRPVWKNNMVVTASLVLLCVALLAGIVALTRPAKPSEPVAPVRPAGEPVDTNRYKVQQAIEAERARNPEAESVPSSGSAAVPSSGNSASSGNSTSTGNSASSGNSASAGNSASSGNSTSTGNSASSGSASKTGYLLEGSDSRYVQRSELAGFTAEECRLARNEIYARHGRKFQDKTIQAYFDSLDWYRPTIEAEDFSEDMLNAYETANRNLIVKYEQEKGYR